MEQSQEIGIVFRFSPGKADKWNRGGEDFYLLVSLCQYRGKWDFLTLYFQYARETEYMFIM